MKDRPSPSMARAIIEIEPKAIQQLTASLSVGAWSVLGTWKTDRHLGLRTARARCSGTWRSPANPTGLLLWARATS